MDACRFARIALRYRRPMGASFAVPVVMSLVLCFALPPRFTAGFRVVSPDGGSNPLLRTLGNGLYDSGMKGWVLPAILRNEDLAVDIATRTFAVWQDGRPRQLSIAATSGARDRAALLRAERKCVRVSADEMRGVVGVSVETPHPELSYRVARYVLERLEGYASGKRRQLRRENEAYYDARIKEASSGLQLAEAELGSFLEENRGWLESDDPGVRLEVERLKRRQEIYTKVYVDLHRERELGDLEAISMVPPLEVLDPPTLPTLKSYPPRKAFLALGLLMGLVLSTATGLVLNLRAKGTSARRT